MEGETDDPGVIALRGRQRRNFLATLFISQGCPMVLAGDELGKDPAGQQQRLLPGQRDRRLDWDTAETDLLDFTRRLIALRAQHPGLRRQHFFTGQVVGRGRKDVRWLRRDGEEMTDSDWGNHERQSLAMVLDGGLIPDRTHDGERITDDTLAVLLHSSEEPCEWQLPPGTWEVVLDTAQPEEEPGTLRLRQSTPLPVEGRSLVLLRLASAPR